MTREEIKLLLRQAQENEIVANVNFCFDKNYHNLIPLVLNEKLFLCIIEDDFMFDGFSIFRIKDIKKIEVKHDFCDKILKEEGLIDTIKVPRVNISNWKSIFQSLKEINKNIIIEKQTIDSIDSEFVIGRIDEIYNHFAYVWHFNADGTWENLPIKIPYSEITNITFSSRYVDVFSKYIENQ